MNWARITNEEWREFQAIPEQGYSHRAWVDGAIRKRLDQLRTDGAIEIAVNAMYEEEFGQSSGYAAKWVLDTYRPIARAALDALLGDD